ncbi:MAG: hypothetical protein A2138_10855 [Deltaproteobacteria bacterium RBG_16_71_12]|nr:MAG: hypothetical protein A2138_10855 [Deltaproteobacteria bacterium RBG_16_71_12]
MAGRVLVVTLLAAAPLLAQAPAPPPPPTAPAPPPTRTTAVILDDRAVKDQAPPAFLARAAEEIGKLRGMQVTRFSEARKRLAPKADHALSGCGDDAGCLATAARAVGGDLVVTVRLTKREGAYFVALTRVNALRPQISEDSGTLAGTDADALAAVPEAVAELFPDAEAR